MAEFKVTRYGNTRTTGQKTSLTGLIDNLSASLQAQAVVSAAAAAANVLYAEMQLRVPVKSGLLKSSLYRWLDRKKSYDGHVVYAIGPRKAGRSADGSRKEARHWHNVEYGHWRYNKATPKGKWLKSKKNKNDKIRGTTGPGGAWKSVHTEAGALEQPVWVEAKPYMRPTLDGKGAEALKAARDRLIERMRELQP